MLFQSIGSLGDLITFQLDGYNNEPEKIYHLIGYVEKSAYGAWMFAFSKFNDPSFSS